MSVRRVALFLSILHVPLAAAAAGDDAARTIGVSGAHQMLIPGNTRIQLILDQPISTKTISTGDTFSLHTASPVVVDGVEVVPSGAAAQGQVVHAQKRGIFGKPAELILTVRYVQAGDVRLPMRGFQAQVGKDRVNASVAAFVFAPFVRGGQIEIPAGTGFSAKVAQDTAVSAALPATARD